MSCSSCECSSINYEEVRRIVRQVILEMIADGSLQAGILDSDGFPVPGGTAIAELTSTEV